MTALASRAASEAEAEAMIGAAVVTRMSLADRRALRRVLHHLIRGTATLTRILRRTRSTRPAVRAVPAIVDRTVRVLKAKADAGQPITPTTAAKTLAIETRRVLSSPRSTARAMAKNVRGAVRAARSNQRGGGSRRYRGVRG